MPQYVLPKVVTFGMFNAKKTMFFFFPNSSSVLLLSKQMSNAQSNVDCVSKASVKYTVDSHLGTYSRKKSNNFKGVLDNNLTFSF